MFDSLRTRFAAHRAKTAELRRLAQADAKTLVLSCRCRSDADVLLWATSDRLTRCARAYRHAFLRAWREALTHFW
jgi:hypothetical protein